MAPNPDSTQRQLITAAETLFAERGINAVSIREITVAAGVRNSTALQYHFENREGLLRAVLRKHHGDVEARRHALLDEFESNPQADLRTLVAAFVRPAASKLTDADGGRAYLRIMAQLVHRPNVDWLEPTSSDRRDSSYRLRQVVAPRLPDVAVKRLHRRFSVIRFTYVELARRAEMKPARSERLFTSHLIDLATALLDAPLSDETAHLLQASSRAVSHD